MAEVTMPRLSDSMEEGTILKWLKSDGDQVSQGDELVEIETDKANMTYEAEAEGTLEIVAKEGDTLPVGDVIAKLGEGGGGESGDEEEPDEDAPRDDEGDDDSAPRDEDDDDSAPRDDEDTDEDAPRDEEDTDEDAPRDEEDTDEDAPRNEEDDSDTAPRDDDEQEGGEGGPASDEESDEAHGEGKVRASPVARRVARDKGIDLAQVKGSGPGGRIVKADVQEPEEKEKTASPPAPAKREAATAKGETETQDLTRLQQTVARRMAESKATAPDFLLNVEVDMEAAVEFRKELKVAAGENGRAPSFNDFVIKASALALRDFPRANGAYRDGKFELYSRVNVGLAVAGQNALVVPTIVDADRKSLGAIAAEARRLAERVREGEITPPELSGGTFTVSNLGMYSIRRITPVINPPQAAILGVGSLEPRAVVREGEIVVRHTMDLTLVCDHRILYGADAAEFLSRIRERLEQPLQLVL
jgi:pyruvate dehydrogenase E2 component (dihydrolipoamide acetyltransferase)